MGSGRWAVVVVDGGGGGLLIVGCSNCALAVAVVGSGGDM